MSKDFSLIGKRVPRVDSLSRVTGEVKFSGDLKFPRMLVGKIKRSPLAHARILHVDTSKAEKLRGVKAVVTGQDTAGVKWGVFRYTQDMELLPKDKVRYFGDEIAAVAAVDEDTAMEALDLISLDLLSVSNILNNFGHPHRQIQRVFSLIAREISLHLFGRIMRFKSTCYLFAWNIMRGEQFEDVLKVIARWAIRGWVSSRHFCVLLQL